jgi:hypothetical protein
MTASRSQAGTNPTASHQRTCFQKTDAIVKDPCRSSRRMRHISTAEAENKGTPHFCRAKEHAPEGAKIRTRADLALYLRTWPSTLLASSAGPVGGTASLRGAAYDASSTQRQHPFSGKLHQAVLEWKPRADDAESLDAPAEKRGRHPRAPPSLGRKRPRKQQAANRFAAVHKLALSPGRASGTPSRSGMP